MDKAVMPSYNTHRFFNYIIVFPAVCGILYFLKQWNVSVGFLLFIGFYLGTSWITPDLDTVSKSTNQNWVWKTLWTPYRCFWKHRESSHTIIEGFVGRMVYFGVIVFLITTLFITREWTNTVYMGMNYYEVIPIVVVVMFGIAIANAGHIFLDRMVTRVKRIL